jgi:hypothetical protein
VDADSLPGLDDADMFGTWVAMIQQQNGLSYADAWLDKFIQGYEALLKDAARAQPQKKGQP